MSDIVSVLKFRILDEDGGLVFQDTRNLKAGMRLIKLAVPVTFSASFLGGSTQAKVVVEFDPPIVIEKAVE